MKDEQIKRTLERRFPAKTRAATMAAQREVPGKRAPDGNRFVDLPSDVVDDVGLWIPRGPCTGNVKLHAAVLSGFAFFYKMNRGEETTLPFETGDTVDLGEDEFLLSARTVAANLYRRWSWAWPERSKVLFDTFHERVRQIGEDLVERGHLNKIGSPLAGSHGRQGTIWSMKGTPVGEAIEACRERPAPDLLLMRPPPAAAFEASGMVNALDLIGGHYAAEKSASDAFSRAEVRRHLKTKGQTAEHLRWVRRRARQKEKSGHVSTGTFRRGKLAERRQPPAAMPHLVLDIDRHHGADSGNANERRIDFDAAREAHRAATSILRTLVHHGCDPEALICCLSGGRGFHIHIPCGMLGIAVFTDQTAAKQSLTRFLGAVIDDEVDANLLSPRHLVRAIGSAREDTDMYKRAFSAGDFLRLPLGEVLERSTAFAPFTIADPREAEPVPALTAALARAGMREKARRGRASSGESLPPGQWSAMAKRAAEGCEEGAWWWPGHQGRNDLIFSLACFLLDTLGMKTGEARARLEAVNEKNEPPLEVDVVEHVVRSAERRTTER